ncbi:hypothetical protein [Sulfurospirillum sp. 1612]|uniref:hypothetical protein n=1 Tax=Sulfurospirillum sp. 1612 TaxID=3094835 RepID=UPI002F933FD6
MTQKYDENRGKDQLLHEIDDTIHEEKNLDFKLLLVVYLSIFVGLLVILPNIYIKNEIYYTSRDISKLSSEYSVLQEENRFLKQKVEYIKFKNQVLDTVF